MKCQTQFQRYPSHKDPFFIGTPNLTKIDQHNSNSGKFTLCIMGHYSQTQRRKMFASNSGFCAATVLSLSVVKLVPKQKEEILEEAQGHTYSQNPLIFYASL